MTASHTRLRMERLTKGICPDCKDRRIEPGTSSCKECKEKRWRNKHGDKERLETLDANPDLDVFAYIPGPLDEAIAQAEYDLRLN